MVIDGFNNAMIAEVLFYDELHQTKNQFEKWQEVAAKVYRIIDTAQSLRDDLTVVFTAHVETADPYVPSDRDKLFTPGKQLKNTIRIESKFNYVFYAKENEGNFFFETNPNHSTARSPFECLEPIVPNDLAAIINSINLYEEGE